MSSASHVSDEEMRYFQFKARQLLLLRKEDQQWREFYRKGSYDCCSCTNPATREVAVQADPKKTTLNTSLGRNSQSVTRVQSKIIPDALNEIKTKLEKIDLALSGRTVNIKEEKTIDQTFPKIQLPRNISQMDSKQNSMNDERLELIQSHLKQSLQRLQSAANWKNPPMHHPKKKESGYFLPHELQKQRTIARNAYLASLAKSKTKPRPITSTAKEKNSSKQVNTQVKTQRPKVVPKTRNKSNLQLNKEQKQEENLIASSQLNDDKDENIETAIDGIVDDLMGETVLLINKIKHIKSERSVNAKHQSQLQADEAVSPKSISFKDPVEKQNIKYLPSGNWAKIRQSLLNIKRLPEEQSSLQNAKQLSPLHNRNPLEKASDHPQSQNTLPKTLASDTIGERQLFVDPKTFQEITKQRIEYSRYLERISRTKKGNFDPWMLVNMISECLLDECLEEVSNELPGSLIPDVFNQEFLQTLSCSSHFEF